MININDKISKEDLKGRMLLSYRAQRQLIVQLVANEELAMKTYEILDGSVFTFPPYRAIYKGISLYSGLDAPDSYLPQYFEQQDWKVDGIKVSNLALKDILESAKNDIPDTIRYWEKVQQLAVQQSVLQVISASIISRDESLVDYSLKEFQRISNREKPTIEELQNVMNTPEIKEF